MAKPVSPAPKSTVKHSHPPLQPSTPTKSLPPEFDSRFKIPDSEVVDRGGLGEFDSRFKIPDSEVVDRGGLGEFDSRFKIPDSEVVDMEALAKFDSRFRIPKARVALLLGVDRVRKTIDSRQEDRFGLEVVAGAPS